MNKSEQLIACLEGEIAKRDARIMGLESQYQRDVWGLNNEGDPIGGEPAGGYANDNARLRAELAAIKAQEPVAHDTKGSRKALGAMNAKLKAKIGRLERELAAAPAAPAGVDGLEVIGWYTEDHLDDKSATTYSREVADRWLAKGWPVNGIANAAAAQAVIDGLRGEVGAQRVKTCTALKERNDAREERDAAATECERLRMQLAACGVVALANTIESAGKLRQMHPDYMSASCSDVAGAVDREIALRTERDQHAQRIGELETALEFACKSLAQVTSSDGSGHADIAVSVLRMAGRKEIDASQIVEAYKAGAKWRIDAALSSGKKGE